jgi:hypothetical protein
MAMARYREGVTEEEFLGLKAAILDLATDGAFDVSQTTGLVLELGVLQHPNAGTIAAVLDDLVDLGELEALGRTEGTGPLRYQLP